MDDDLTFTFLCIIFSSMIRADELINHKKNQLQGVQPFL